MDFYTSLVYGRGKPVIGKLAYYLLKLLGVEIPCSVRIGKDFELAHGGFGVVIHSKTVIGDRVKIYPGAGTGRADIHRPISQSKFEGILIEDDVILSSGQKYCAAKYFASPTRQYHRCKFRIVGINR
jgi:serine acetyltransferase